MVYSTTRYYCSKCRKGHESYDAAHDCEIDHIVQESVERSQEAINAAFDRAFPCRLASEQGWDDLGATGLYPDEK